MDSDTVRASQGTDSAGEGEGARERERERERWPYCATFLPASVSSSARNAFQTTAVNLAPRLAEPVVGTAVHTLFLSFLFVFPFESPTFSRSPPMSVHPIETLKSVSSAHQTVSHTVEQAAPTQSRWPRIVTAHHVVNAMVLHFADRHTHTHTHTHTRIHAYTCIHVNSRSTLSTLQGCWMRKTSSPRSGTSSTTRESRTIRLVSERARMNPAPFLRTCAALSSMRGCTGAERGALWFCAHIVFRFRFWSRLPGDPSVCDVTDSCVYLCGNSLGLQPKQTKEFVTVELDKWARR